MKDYLRVSGKAAIVTGGGGGIGEGIAKEFASYGVRVMICDINDANGLRVRDEIRAVGNTAEYCHCDVCSVDEVRNLVKTTVDAFGTVDILINNAGGGERCANYASAKAGLIGLTTSIAREVAEFNINVNVIPVPTTDTPGLRAADFELVDDELPLIPLGRIAQPIDIANTALFLVSEASNYVTGQIVAPNGGKRMLV